MTDDINNIFSDFGARSAKFEELLKKYQTIDENGEILPAQKNEEKPEASTPENQGSEIPMPEIPETEAPRRRVKKKKIIKKKSEKLTDENGTSEKPVIKKKKSEKLKTKKNNVEEPEIAEPEIEEPEIEEPEIVEPEIEEPEIVEPEIVEPEIVKPEIVEPEIVEPEIEKFDFDMSEKDIEQFDFEMSEYEIEQFDLEMNEIEEVIGIQPENEDFIEIQSEIEEIIEAQLEIEEIDFEAYEPRVDYIDEEPVQFNFSLPELEPYESVLPESEQFDFTKDFDSLVPERPEEAQPEQFDFAMDETEQFDFGLAELDQINEIQPEEFDFVTDEAEQSDFEPEQFEEAQPEAEQPDYVQTEQIDEVQSETEQYDYAEPEPEQFEEIQYEAEQFDSVQPEGEQPDDVQPEYEAGFSFDDQSVQMQTAQESQDEPDYSYDLDMFGTRQTKSTIDIDSFDDSWLDTALDRTLFYNAVRPSPYDMPEPATYAPVDVEKDPFEPNVQPITQETGFVEQFPDEADKNAMAGGYIAPSDFSDFNFDPDSGLDFDYEETNAYMQNFSAAENSDGLNNGEESEKKKSERTKQPASRIFQRIIKPPKEKDQNKTD